MGKAGEQIVAVLVAIVGLATVAVIFSNKAQTPKVIDAFGQAFSNAIKQAVSPIL